MTSSTPTLNQLLRRWEAMRSRILAHLCSRGWSRDDAEDLFGEAILRAVDRRQSLNDCASAEAWFWQLATRLAIDEARKKERRPLRRTDRELDRLPANDGEESTCRCSLQMLEDLPDAYHDILTSVDLDGQTVKDYADSECISANNASVRLYRARRALRDKLKKTCQTTTVAECMDCGCAA